MKEVTVIASNRRFRDSNNQRQEDFCFVGIVAWNKLAESCNHRNTVEIKARRIQFLTEEESQILKD